MQLSGLHILLTYQCTLECDHCFVWGGPRQSGSFGVEAVRRVLDQAKEAGVRSIYFEGGEPFLYYAVLVEGVRLAAQMGFEVGIVTNAYWASSAADAEEWLRPFAGLLSDLTVSSNSFHCEERFGERPLHAQAAARKMSIPTGAIRIARPGAEAKQIHGQIVDEGAVVFRGRAAERLAGAAEPRPWAGFNSCPHEDLRDPGRVHLDPFGNLHICQGLVIGNLFERPLKEICENYDPEAHPVCGPLLEGGPAELVSEHHLPHREAYADACHLCYESRKQLRTRFPESLTPAQMYGE